MSRPIAVIELFSGCGAATLGFIQGGARVVVSFENWEPAIAVSSANKEPPHRVVNMKLGTRHAWEYITELFYEFRISGHHIHIHASPPCQAFSVASTTAPSEGGFLLHWTLDLIQELNPESWSLENVPPTRKYLPTWCADKWQIVNCADYGVPQTRKRMIVGEGFILSPTHENQWVSVLDALPHLDSMELIPPPSMAKHYQYASINKPFPTVTSISARQLRLNLDGCGASMSRRAKTADCALNTPSMTVRGAPGAPSLRSVEVDKAVKIRSLTITETAILQGFPADYDFEPAGSQKARWTMIGNALPPQITKAIIEGLI